MNKSFLPEIHKINNCLVKLSMTRTERTVYHSVPSKNPFKKNMIRQIIEISEEPGFIISRSKFESVYASLQSIANEWKNDLDQQTRFTCYIALFNGCALFCIPSSICEKIIDKCTLPEEADFLFDLLRFIYCQLDQNTSDLRFIKSKLEKYNNSDCPYIVALYLFIEAICRYFPDEKDTSALNEAKHFYSKLPDEYKDFILMKNMKPTANPALHQYLLPQLNYSSLPIKPSTKSSNPDYLERQCFLHIKISVFFNRTNNISLSDKLQSLMDAEQYINHAAESLFTTQSILRDFAHTYGNMKTTRLDELTDKLLQFSQKYEDPELLKLARIAATEAKIKHDLSTGIQLMHLRCREDMEELGKRLADSIISSHQNNSSLDGESIENIIDFSLKLCLYRVFYDGDRKAKIAREQFKTLTDDFPKTIQSFENDVIVKNMCCVSWLTTLKKPIQIFIDISPEWKELYFFKGSFASILLEDLFGELFFNSLKYADLTFPIRIVLDSLDEYLTVFFTNHCSANVNDYAPGSGLESRNVTMSILNGTKKGNIDGQKDDKDNFVVHMKLRKDLLQIKEVDLQQQPTV